MFQLEGASSGKHSVAPLVPTIQQENGSSTITTTITTTSNTPTITTTTVTTTTTTGSGGIGPIDTFVDESDGAHTPDQTRTKVAREHLQAKIHKIMGQIKSEQNSKEGKSFCLRYKLNPVMNVQLQIHVSNESNLCSNIHV